jgi:hypothetical protein
MPWIQQGPFAFRVADLETDGERLWADHWVRPRSWCILVVLLDSRIVRQILALREDALGIKLLELCWSDLGTDRLSSLRIP